MFLLECFTRWMCFPRKREMVWQNDFPIFRLGGFLGSFFLGESIFHLLQRAELDPRSKHHFSGLAEKVETNFT